MKKLIFVTLLAVSASWVLSQSEKSAPGPQTPTTSKTEFPEIRVADEAPGLLDPPGARRKADRNRAKRVVRTSNQATTLRPPSRPIPDWFPKSEVDSPATTSDASGARVFVSLISVSEERARENLRETVTRGVADWIAADVPSTWKVPTAFIDGMVQDVYVQEFTRPKMPTIVDPARVEINPETTTAPESEALGLDQLCTFYRVGWKLEFSADRRAQIIELYRRDLAAHRMQRLGGGLALALIGLAVLSGYIKADEATKGYYTNRLRLVAAAGLGAAGVVAYRFLV